MHTMLSLVPMYSPLSMFSVLGIMLLFICLFTVFTKRWSGVLTCLTIGCGFALLVGSYRPNLSGSLAEGESSGLAPCIQINGQWENEFTLMIDEQSGKGYYYYEKYKDQPRYYAIHVLDGLPAFAWHPDALWWSPVTAVLIGIFVLPFLPARKN